MLYRGNACSHIGWLTRLSLTLMLALVFLQSGTMGLDNFRRFDPCGPPDVQIPDSCRYGNFSLNFNTEICKPRTLCYTGPNEPCQNFGDKSDCLPPLHCNCGRCSANLDIWCRSRNLPPLAALMKRMQPILQEYDSQDDTTRYFVG